MDAVQSYGVKVFLKGDKDTPTFDIKCVYDGVDMPFYYFIKKDGTQYSILLDTIGYFEFSPERAIQIEQRKAQEQQQQQEGTTA